MTVPFPADLRLRLVRAVEEGSSARAAAARFDVSASAAIKLMQRVRATARRCLRRGSYRKLLLADHDDLLRELTAKRKGITLAEIRRRKRSCATPASRASTCASLAVDTVAGSRAPY